MLKRTKEIAEKMSQLDALKNYFEEIKIQREESFENKSEKWQESEKGEEYSSDTDTIAEIVDSIESAFGSCEELFEEN